MSTTIAHPRSVPSGPSGKLVAGFVAAAIAVVGVGYGIVNLGEPVPVDVSPSSAQGADRVIIQRGAELAAQEAAARAVTERMLAINEFYPQSTARGADQLIMQKAAELAALREALDRTERMMELNQIRSDQSTSAGADLVIAGKLADFLSNREETLAEATKGVVLGESSLGVWDANVDFLRIQHAARARNAQWNSKIEFLTEQWNAQHGQGPDSTGGGGLFLLK